VNKQSVVIAILVVAVAVLLYVAFGSSPIPAPNGSDRTTSTGTLDSPSNASPLDTQRGDRAAPQQSDLAGVAPTESPSATETDSGRELRVESKLIEDGVSDIPHTILGAWDDRPDSLEVGQHRVLIAVVEPDTSDADLEDLVRDIRDRHRDAAVLDVRVYDSEAAVKSSGARTVAEVKRNDRLGYDGAWVRGQEIQF